MSRNDQFEKKYVEFINKLLKFWYIWAGIVFLCLFIRNTDVLGNNLVLENIANAIWKIVMRIRYLPGVLGVAYIVCKRRIAKDI